MGDSNIQNNNLSSKGEQKNKALVAIIIVSCIIVLVLGGYIIYDKVLKNDKKKGELPIVSPTNTPTNNQLPEWVSYLLNQDIISVSETHITDWADENNYTCVENDFTKAQLESILEKMTASQLKKYYTQEITDKISNLCSNHGIIVKYGNNNELYIFQYKKIIVNSKFDSELMNLIEKDVDIREEEKDSNLSVVYEYNWDDDFINTIIE